MHREVSINGGASCLVNVTRGSRLARVWRDAKAHDASLVRSGPDWTVEIDGMSADVTLAVDSEQVLIHAFGRTWRVAVVDPAKRALGAGEQSDVARAPMPGVTVSVMVEPGEGVLEGQPMVVIESMKMQTEIAASRNGTVDRVNVQVGDVFPLGAPLVTLVPLTEGA